MAEEAPSPDQAQLDRIEGKLDQLLQRLGLGPLPSPAPEQAAAAAPAVDSTAYAPGAIAVIHPAPATTRVLAEVPPDSVGGFVYTGGPLALHDLSDRGVRYAGLAGLEFQGWLKVTAPGRAQLGADYRGSFGQAVLFGTDCLLEAWLEGHQIGQESTRSSPAPTAPAAPASSSAPTSSPASTSSASGPPACPSPDPAQPASPSTSSSRHPKTSTSAPSGQTRSSIAYSKEDALCSVVSRPLT